MYHPKTPSLHSGAPGASPSYRVARLHARGRALYGSRAPLPSIIFVGRRPRQGRSSGIGGVFVGQAGAHKGRDYERFCTSTLSGNRTVKVEPSDPLAASIVPSCASTTARQIYRPRPTPSIPLPGARSKRLKIRGRNSGGIPGPRSRTVTIACLSRRLTDTSIGSTPPYLRAFPTREEVLTQPQRIPRLAIQMGFIDRRRGMTRQALRQCEVLHAVTVIRFDDPERDGTQYSLARDKRYDHRRLRPDAQHRIEANAFRDRRQRLDRQVRKKQRLAVCNNRLLNPCYRMHIGINASSPRVP